MSKEKSCPFPLPTDNQPDLSCAGQTLQRCRRRTDIGAFAVIDEAHAIHLADQLAAMWQTAVLLCSLDQSLYWHLQRAAQRQRCQHIEVVMPTC